MFLRVKNKIYSRLLALVILLIVTSWILVSKDMLAKNFEVFQVESGSSISLDSYFLDFSFERYAC